MALFADISKRDISFLESEFLTYLLMRFFIGDNSVNINGSDFFYIPVKNIVFSNENTGEKVSIETETIDTCKELYTALKNAKSVSLLQLQLKNETMSIDICLKNAPLRITKVGAPKSIAEDYVDKIIERKLYVRTVFDFYDIMIKDFVNIRISNEWFDFLKNFKNFLKTV